MKNWQPLSRIYRHFYSKDQKKTPKRLLYAAILLCVALLLLSACGGGSNNSDEGNAETAGRTNQAAVPTMPAPSFSSVGEQSAITKTVASGTQQKENTEADLALGERLYGTKCAECHGADAEGIDGQGGPLIDSPLTLDELTDLLRTGGELGPDHLFGPQALSPNGMGGIFVYLESLK